MKEPHDRRRGGEPLSSLMGGVPSLAIGVGALVLLVSYVIDEPIGPPGLYRFEWYYYIRPSGPTIPSDARLFRLVLPSEVLLGMLVAGVWCGGLGIFITHHRRRDRWAITSIAGSIACGAAFVLAWAWISWAAIR